MKGLIFSLLCVALFSFTQPIEGAYPPAEFYNWGTHIEVHARGEIVFLSKENITLYCVLGKSVAVMDGRKEIYLIKDHSRVSVPASTSLTDLCYKLTPIITQE